MATVPVQYTDVIISMHEEDYASFTRKKAAQEADVAAHRKTYPQLKLHHKISLGNFGAGRHLRFGDLTEDGKLDMILCQHHKRVLTDRYADISCMTAFDMNGQILWQIGEPCSDSAHGDLTADLPFQITDINGDGKNEVVTVMDFVCAFWKAQPAENWQASPFRNPLSLWKHSTVAFPMGSTRLTMSISTLCASAISRATPLPRTS